MVSTASLVLGWAACVKKLVILNCAYDVKLAPLDWLVYACPGSVILWQMMKVIGAIRSSAVALAHRYELQLLQTELLELPFPTMTGVVGAVGDRPLPRHYPWRHQFLRHHHLGICEVGVEPE